MTVISKAARVTDRLHELDLTRKVLEEAILAGLLEWASCTELDPISARGYEFWRLANRRIREQLVTEGWRPHDEQGLPLVVNPLSGIALTVASGHGGVGDVDGQPRTRNPKGTTAREYIRDNRIQLRLFHDKEAIRVVPTPKNAGRVTWILLAEVDSEGEARCELSLPAGRDGRGHINEWHERIILEPVTLDQSPWREDDDIDGGGELDVPVARR